jgi:PAS domain S-box-containing protein
MEQDQTQAFRDRPFGVDLSIAVFDRATRVARALFPGGDSLITLVENGVAWRSREFSRAFAADDPATEMVIATGKLMWIEDARADAKWRNQSVVVGPPFLRSWIGAPIRLEDGSTPGALCVVSSEPQAYDAARAARLQDLADFVADEWARAKSAQTHSETAMALDTARSRFAALAETLPVSLVMTDRSMRVLGASRVWREDVGLADSQVVGRPLFELSPLYEPLRDSLARAVNGETVEGGQLALKRADGETAWLHASITSWRDGDGKTAGLVITASDVTQLKQALDIAERSEERLNLALELAEVHVWEIDYVQRKLFKAGAEDTFFERPQTYQDLYRDIFITIDPRDHAAVHEAWRRHVEEGAPYCPQYRIARTDGVEIWAEGVIRYFADDKGRPMRMVGALRNITQAKQAEQKLMRAIEAAETANRAKSQFLATMSHEIRTPLNGVLGMAQAMAADELSPTQRDRLAVVRESGQSLLAILNDVLDISKIEAGKLELEEAEFDMEDVAASVRQAFLALADKKGLALNCEVADDATGLYLGDATRVRQILYNLVSNALKFTETGAVNMRVTRSGRWVRLAVEDSGIGIARADLKRLFEKFEQADASTTRRYGGSGLGLAICRQLAELMGGRIRVRSVLGRGTTFVASLRLRRVGDAGERRTEPVAEKGPAVGTPRLRVLAAEDNPINQLVLKTLLDQIGVEPTVVEDGQTALAAWEAAEWDVILMDVQMPRMDGPTATQHIRRREAELGRTRTPIIALTANAMSHQVAEYLASGMDGFVAKPIEIAQLFAALQKALETAEGPQEEAA